MEARPSSFVQHYILHPHAPASPKPFYEYLQVPSMDVHELNDLTSFSKEFSDLKDSILPDF